MGDRVLASCSICGVKKNELMHLPLYCAGSEGIDVCFECKLALTRVAREMTRAAFAARKDVYLRLKKEKRDG